MNERQLKGKKHSTTHTRSVLHPHLDKHAHLDKHPSASSIKLHQAHCQPKNPPNIAAYQQYAHPRRHDDHKENHKGRQNHNTACSREQHPKKNVLMLPRRSNQGEEVSRKTQKKVRTRQLRSEWVSPDDEDLGCNEHLSSQLFRRSGRNSVSKGKRGYTGSQFMSVEEQLAEFQRSIPILNQRAEEQALIEQVRLEEQHSKQPHYPDYLNKHINITWRIRAHVVNWVMGIAADWHCKRQTLAASVNLFDRYLAACSPVSREKLQLLVSACLLLADKLETGGEIRACVLASILQEAHDEQQLKDCEKDIAITLRYRLKAPTINSWANRLCVQWDYWISQKNTHIETRFKGVDDESYHCWRWLTQYIDFALLDIQTLQYKNRTLAAAFLYLTLLLKLEIHSPDQIAFKFRRESRHILGDTPFNRLFSEFLHETFGFPLQEILPTVQYCSGFMVLPLQFKSPELDPMEDKLTFEEYCCIQTRNQYFMEGLAQLDRGFW